MFESVFCCQLYPNFVFVVWRPSILDVDGDCALFVVPMVLFWSVAEDWLPPLSDGVLVLILVSGRDVFLCFKEFFFAYVQPSISFLEDFGSCLLRLGVRPSLEFFYPRM